MIFQKFLTPSEFIILLKNIIYLPAPPFGVLAVRRNIQYFRQLNA